MCTARLPTAFVLVPSDDHQMSVSGEVSKSSGEGVPYHVTYPMIHFMLPIPLWTDTRENITFLQLRLRAVKTFSADLRNQLGDLMPYWRDC